MNAFTFKIQITFSDGEVSAPTFLTYEFETEQEAADKRLSLINEMNEDLGQYYTKYVVKCEMFKLSNSPLHNIDELVENAFYEDMDELIEAHDELEGYMNNVQDKIDELEAFDIKTEEEAIESYICMINECTEIPDNLPTFIYTGTAAEMMKENDPTMYRCGFHDYLDSLEKDGQCVPDCTNWSI